MVCFGRFGLHENQRLRSVFGDVSEKFRRCLTNAADASSPRDGGGSYETDCRTKRLPRTLTVIGRVIGNSLASFSLLEQITETEN